MYICLIGLFLATFQVTCDGAPKRSFLALKHPVDAPQEKKLVEKRALCTDGELDKYPTACPTWEASGYCSPQSIYYNFMQTNCYASCGNCEVPPTPTTPPTPTPPPTPPPEVDENACLAAHNAKRALHQNTNPLTWSDTLAQHAKAWADFMAENGTFFHDPNNKDEGENLYWYSSSTGVRSCEDAVESWYAEINDYNYNNPGFSSGTGHFTQVVWKATTLVGAALAKVNGQGYTETYVVARYSPHGNYLGQFASNVMPTIN